jgi:hypothetical protein
MESGEFIPAGSSEAEAEMLEAHNTWVPFVLPVVFTAAAWAVDRFTKSALGGWRYIPVVLLGAGAVSFTFVAIIAAVVLNDAKPGGRRMPRWLARNANVLLALLFVAGIVVEIVRAVHYHSVIDVVSALFMVLCAGFLARSSTIETVSRNWRHAQSAASLLFALWILVVAAFHLR